MSSIGRLAAWVYALGAALITLVRAMPNMGSPDRGVFVSVAERMAAGDRLYVDVWDNKDPVFYWLMATGRLVTGLADYALEVGWLTVVAVAVFALARGLVDTYEPALVAAATSLLAVTGAAYIAGYTYLPGTALVLVAVALAARHRPATLGAVIAVLTFTKPMMLPIAVVAVAVWWLAGSPRRDVGRRLLRDLVRALAAFVPVAAAFVLLLAARGELGGWVAAQLDNVDYSQQRLRDTGQNPVVDHLSRVVGARELLILAVVVAVGVGSWWWARPGSTPAAQRIRVLAVATLATTATAVAIIAATGLGPWHNQLLQPSIALACALVAVPTAWLLARPGTAVAGLVTVGGLLVVAVFGWVVGGAAPAQDYRDSLRFYRGSIGVLLQTPADARAILTLGDHGSYARLGGEYDDGHARGLRGWTLACPRFHQYFFQPASTLTAVLDCVRTAPVVLVASTFEPKPDSMLVPDWNAFVVAGERLLARDFDCTPHEGFRVCVRKATGR